ncbi:MAG: cytochrome c [Chloroflexi bacterium]|nr:cytochrome c [Chloroflexota bacterium]
MTKRASIVLAMTAAAGVFAAACGGGAATPAKPTAAPAAASPAAAKTGNVAQGKTLYTQTCVACHGPEAKGVTGLGKDMTTSAFVKGQTDSQLVDFIKKGRPANDPANTTKVEMPPKGANPSLTDQQLADIVAFIRTLQR